MTHIAHKARLDHEAGHRAVNIIAYQKGEAVGFWKHLNEEEFRKVVAHCLYNHVSFSTGHSDAEMCALFGDIFESA